MITLDDFKEKNLFRELAFVTESLDKMPNEIETRHPEGEYLCDAMRYASAKGKVVALAGIMKKVIEELKGGCNE